MKRLKKGYSQADYRRLYSHKHSSSKFVDHQLRVATTRSIIDWLVERHDIKTIGDMSVGDGQIHFAQMLKSVKPVKLYLGDYNEESDGLEFAHEKYVGDIYETIKKMPDVDLYVCSETIEHVEYPLVLLRLIRKKAKMLVLTTPEDETEETNNPEHLWSWSEHDMKNMLLEAGFTPKLYNGLDFRLENGFPYKFQMWVAE